MLIENASSLAPSERQRIISSIKIEHDRYKEAVEGLRQFHYPVDGGLPGAGGLSMLVGDSRTGKSFSVTQYVKGFQPSIGDDGVKIPVLYVEAPVEGGVRGLLECLADGLRILHSRRMNSPSLLNLILKAFVEREVQLLVIDETQAIFRQENKRLLSFGRDLLRKILNLNTLNIICVGLVETYNVLRADAQLTGRGGLHYRLLQAYSWDSRDEQDSFRLLCRQLDRALPFDAPAGLSSPATAQRLYFVSEGIIGRLINFLRSAAYLAINDQSESISDAHLARAFESQKPLGTSFNPFVHDLSHAPKARTVARQSDSAAQMFSKKGGGLGRAA